MADSAFLAMRADLVARGLLLRQAQDGRAGYLLTSAGHAHVDLLLEELLTAEAPEEPSKPRVRWNIRRRGHCRAG